MNEFLSNPAVIAALLVMLSPLSLYVASLFMSGKKKQDLEAEQATRTAERAEREAAHQEALDLIRYGQEIAAAKQVAVAEEIKAELVATVKASKAEDVKAQEVVIVKLDEIAKVGEQTHAASNGTNTALHRVEEDLRNRLQAEQLARANDAVLAALELQAVKDSLGKDLAYEREKVVMLTQQLAAMTPLVATLGPQRALPAAPETPATEQGSAQVVHVPAITLPVQDATPVPSLVTL